MVFALVITAIVLAAAGGFAAGFTEGGLYVLRQIQKARKGG
ncbi:MAG TPA: hypothetical protein VFA50_15045 [Stellaceae bacterium]|nr:hypothetical protein [Stellaceae bacterium]